MLSWHVRDETTLVPPHELVRCLVRPVGTALLPPLVVLGLVVGTAVASATYRSAGLEVLWIEGLRAQTARMPWLGAWEGFHVLRACDGAIKAALVAGWLHPVRFEVEVVGS